MKTFKFTAIVLLLLTLLASCNKGGPEQAAAPRQTVNADTIVLQAEVRPDFLEVTGAIEGSNVIPVATKLMSQILYMGADVGDSVAKGDVLARIDDSEISALRMEAAAYYAEAAAALAEVDAGVEQSIAATAQARAGLAQAKAAAADAEVDAKRYRMLVETDTVARVVAEKYELAFEVATENVNLAEAAVEQAEAATEQARSRTPQVAAKQQQASAKDAQAAALQQYSVLTAPIDGIIIQRLSDPGQLTIPGQPIYMLSDDLNFTARVNVAEESALGLAIGQAVDVVCNSASGAEVRHKAVVSTISGASSPATHTVPVELEIPSGSGLMSGMFARALIPNGESTVLVIPASAVVREGDSTFVWRVAESGMLSQAPVETAGLEDGSQRVIQGLSEGDVIVINPATGLYPGAAVDLPGGGS